MMPLRLGGFALAFCTPRKPAATGPVRGEVRVEGAHFGKGTDFNPDTCRIAANPDVTAIALFEAGQPNPVAWVIAASPAELAAVDVQRDKRSDTIRFHPASCTRLHGAIRRKTDANGTTLEGYGDAECEQAGDTPGLHVDFAGCH